LLRVFPPLEPTEHTRRLIIKEFDIFQMTKFDESQLSKSIEAFWIDLHAEDNKFANLCKYFMQLLVLPHTTAEVERIFSMVTTTRTKTRTRMKTETLESLIMTRQVCKAKKRIVDLYPSLLSAPNISKETKKEESELKDNDNDIDSQATSSGEEDLIFISDNEQDDRP
jgi:hypothetical protein